MVYNERWWENKTNNFICSSCQKSREIGLLKGSYSNNVELQKLKAESDKYINTLLKLDLVEAEAERDNDFEKLSQAKRTREKVNNLQKSVWNRLRMFGGTMICANCWNRASHKAQKTRGDTVEFQCKSCGQTVSGKRHRGHFLNLDGVNPAIRVSVCKSCWLEKVIPNDKIQYCPWEGEGYNGYDLDRPKYDCQCKVRGKTTFSNLNNRTNR